MKKTNMAKRKIQFPSNCKNYFLDFKQRYLIILILGI